MTLTWPEWGEKHDNKFSEITIVYIEDSDDVRFAVNKRSRWLVIALFPVAMQNQYSPYSKSGQHYYTDRCQVTGISGLELLSYINGMDSKIPVF